MYISWILLTLFIKEKRDDVLDEMYKKKTQLANNNDEGSKKKLEEVELEMPKLYSEDMYSKIQEELKGINSEDGGWNPGYLWKLGNKLHPRPIDPQRAMENADGVLLTDQIEIEKEALNHFDRLFKDLPMNKDYLEVIGGKRTYQKPG